LALHQALAAGGELRCLVTMLTEKGERSRSHGLALAVLEAQAAAIGVPLLTAAATWDGYANAMVGLLGQARRLGATHAVFGDIDIPSHRAWEENVCHQADLNAVLPLWQMGRWALLEAWWNGGFEARIVATRDGVVPRRYLGRIFDRPTAEELAELGVDACGENGEFHTVATRGPIFRKPIELVLRQQHLHSGCWFQDVSLGGVSIPPG
jgi:uncharacterized protein (TIGR00290 family)